jgi:hypothetical protein
MSFTQDELQAFHTVLEQRLQAHRAEVEQALDERFSKYRRENEHRLLALQHEILRVLSFKLAEFQERVENLLNQKTNAWEQALASRGAMDEALLANGHQQVEAIEVQAELPWEDLAEVIGKTLDGHLQAYKEEAQRLIAQQEQQLAEQVRGIQDELASRMTQQVSQVSQGTQPGISGDTLQEVLHGIEHLERVIESLQVVMTANHALLSDRLYSHQQQPVERAHPVGRWQSRAASGPPAEDNNYAGSPAGE